MLATILAANAIILFSTAIASSGQDSEESYNTTVYVRGSSSNNCKPGPDAYEWIFDVPLLNVKPACNVYWAGGKEQSMQSITAPVSIDDVEVDITIYFDDKCESQMQKREVDRCVTAASNPAVMGAQVQTDFKSFTVSPIG